MSAAIEMEHEAFTIDVDKRIIEGFIWDKELMMAELKRELGLSKSAIQDRATKLGVTKQFIEQARLTEVKLKGRACLRCDRPFLSQGPWNRLCSKCRSVS